MAAVGLAGGLRVWLDKGEGKGAREDSLLRPSSPREGVFSGTYPSDSLCLHVTGHTYLRGRQHCSLLLCARVSQIKAAFYSGERAATGDHSAASYPAPELNLQARSSSFILPCCI